jgi:hypothetical protein
MRGRCGDTQCCTTGSTRPTSGVKGLGPRSAGRAAGEVQHHVEREVDAAAHGGELGDALGPHLVRGAGHEPRDAVGGACRLRHWRSAGDAGCSPSTGSGLAGAGAGRRPAAVGRSRPHCARCQARPDAPRRRGPAAGASPCVSAARSLQARRALDGARRIHATAVHAQCRAGMAQRQPRGSLMEDGLHGSLPSWERSSIDNA